MDREASMTHLTLRLDGRETRVEVDTVIVAGWTGRDRAAVEEHVAELGALGVARPSSVPVFYRISASRMTTAPIIEAPSTSSGEVEPVLLHHDGRLWLGVGSDHTDREVETYGVAVSKQLCDKPMAPELWLYEQAAEHWDRLVLRSWIDDDVLYQEGGLAGLLHPNDLLPLARPQLRDGALMLCGTVPVIGAIRPAGAFRYELVDPVLARTIRARYVMRTLPLVS
jgi:hypothetical protein